MNKIFTKKLLMAMMLLTVSITISAQTKKEVFEGYSSFRMTPADYSVGNKSSLYFYNFDGYYIYGSEAPTFYIYDSNFTKQKTIEVPVTPVSYYSQTQERERGQVVKKMDDNSGEEKISTWDPNTGDEVFEFTTESAENYIKERYGSEIRTKEETSEAIIFYLTDEYSYFRYENYGYQYPERYFKYEKSTSFLYECNDSYSEAWTYTDTWKEPVREDNQTYAAPMSISRISDVDTKSFRLSQTLFNTDNAYEYVMPIITTETFEEQEMGWDDAKQQEVVVRKITGTTTRVSGLKIVNENGATVNTITFDSNFGVYFTTSGIDMIDLDGNIYLAVEGNLKKSATESVRATIVYSIDAQTNSVRQLSMEEGMRISPTMARRSEMITITLEGNNDQSRQVNIVNATGRTVKRINVPAGQRSVQVNASELSTGLNIVNVSGQKTQTCKIIVR